MWRLYCCLAILNLVEAEEARESLGRYLRVDGPDPYAEKELERLLTEKG